MTSVSSVYGLCLLLGTSALSHGAVLNLPPTPFLPYPYKGGFTHLVPSQSGLTIALAEICFFLSSFQVIYDDDGNEIEWNNGGEIVMGQGNSGTHPGSSTFPVEVLIDATTGWPMQLNRGTLLAGSVSGGFWQSNWRYEWAGGDGGLTPPWGIILPFRILASDGVYYGYEILEWEQTGPTDEQPISSYKLAGLGRIESSPGVPILVVPEPAFGILFAASTFAFLRRRRRYPRRTSMPALPLC